ncbi:MAG TPA: antitoxin Xre/MbcA/ParS toxin-binding domain-containing protein [Verrucomicrobiae bacterium]|jgi:putative toxin-antitoxin system antitoxin component (TIGR02293 family)
MSQTLTKSLTKKYISKAVIRPTIASATLKKYTGGIVAYCVHGPTGRITVSPSRLVEVLRAGLPVKELDDLQSSLDVPMDKLVPMLGISKATLHRRKAVGRLDQAESDRVVRFARLMGKAVEVFESEESARQWLNSPQFGLGGAVPLQYAETEVGAREVENLLGRIEYGVYS